MQRLIRLTSGLVPSCSAGFQNPLCVDLLSKNQIVTETYVAGPTDILSHQSYQCDPLRHQAFPYAALHSELSSSPSNRCCWALAIPKALLRTAFDSRFRDYRFTFYVILLKN